MSGREDPSIAQRNRNRNADSKGKGPAQQYEVTEPDDQLGPLRKDSEESSSDQESVYYSIHGSSSTLNRSFVLAEYASTSARLISTTITKTVSQVTEGPERVAVIEHDRTMRGTIQMNMGSTVQTGQSSDRPGAESSMFSDIKDATISGGSFNQIASGGRVINSENQNVVEPGGIVFQHCTFTTSPGETIAGLSTFTGQKHHLGNIGHNINQTPAQPPVRSAHRNHHHTDDSNSPMNDNRYFQASSEYARVPHQAPQIQQNDDRQLEYTPIRDRQYQCQESRERQESEDHDHHNQVVEDQRRQADRDFQRRAPTAIPSDEPALMVRQDVQIQQSPLSVLVSPTENIASDSSVTVPIVLSPTLQSSMGSSIITKISSAISTLSNMSDSKYEALHRFNRKKLLPIRETQGHGHIYQLMDTTMPQFENPSSDIALWRISPGTHDNASGSGPSRTELSHRAIDIGDVGFFNESGGFDPLFNFLYSKEENSKAHLQPPLHGFTPFPNRTGKPHRMYKADLSPGTIYYSKGIKFDAIPDNLGANGSSIDVTFQHDGDGSAIVIPEGGRVAGLPVSAGKHFRKDILEYVATNAPGWYQHVKRILQGQHVIRNGELLVVTAIYTAPYRGLVVFSKDKFPRSRNVNPFVAKFHGTKGNYSWKFQASNGYSYVISNSPHSRDLEGTSQQAYCFAIQPWSVYCTKKDYNNLHT